MKLHSAGSFRQLIKVLPGIEKRLVFITLFGILATVFELIAVGLILVIIDVALGAPSGAVNWGPLSFIAAFQVHLQNVGWVWSGVLVALIVLVQSVLRAVSTALSAALQLDSYQDLRERIFLRKLTWNPGQISETSGEITNIIQNITWDAADAALLYSRLIVTCAVSLMYIAALLTTSWPLSVVAISIGLLGYAAILLLRRRLSKLGAQTLDQKNKMTAHVIENIHARRTLVAYGAEKHILAQSALLFSQLSTLFRKTVLLSMLTKPISDGVGVLMIGGAVLVAVTLDYSPITILGFVAFLFRAQPHILAIHETLARLATLEPSISIVEQHLRPAKTQLGSEKLKRGKGDLVLDGVSLAFPQSQHPVLRDINLVFSGGKTTVLLGRSGAGKTTMINLMSGLLPPSAGEVLFDGQSISRFAFDRWRRCVAMTGQDIVLVNSSVRENLCLGAPSATAEQIHTAIELARAQDIIDLLPCGLDTIVGEGGTRLSGGQRQRLCLARALLTEPDILLLDEATNAIDAAEELDVYRGIRRHYPHLTMVIVAHRPALIDIADDVVVLERGQVLTKGHPDQVRMHPWVSRLRSTVDSKLTQAPLS